MLQPIHLKRLFIESVTRGSNKKVSYGVHSLLAKQSKPSFVQLRKCCQTSWEDLSQTSRFLVATTFIKGSFRGNKMIKHFIFQEKITISPKTVITGFKNNKERSCRFNQTENRKIFNQIKWILTLVKKKLDWLKKQKQNND